MITFFPFIVKGQHAKLLKQRIQTHIQYSIKDPTLADYWLICNTDSSYYKKDTLNLLNSGTGLYNITCSSNVIWYFLDKKHFFCAETIICNEPGIYKVKYKNKYYCKIAWKIDGDKLFLMKRNKENKIEKYLVVDFTVKYLFKEIIECYVLKLKRINFYQQLTSK